MPQIVPAHSVARPHYYDRNAAVVADVYDASVNPPFGSIQVLSYTPPTGSVSFMEAICVAMERVAVAAVANWSYIFMTYDPVDSFEVQEITLPFILNAINDHTELNVTTFGFTRPGDTIRFYRNSGSTTGTIRFTTAFKATEYSES